MSDQASRGRRKQGDRQAGSEPAPFVGERSSQWASKLDPNAEKGEEKPRVIKDTRRFADGRVR